MNLAATTIILVFLLTPGLVFRKFYFSEQFSKQYQRPNYIELLLSGFLASIVLHFFVVWIFNSYLNIDVEIAVVGAMLYGGSEALESFKLLDRNIDSFILYCVIIYLMAMFGGWAGNKIIRSAKWDREIKLYRYENYWHYILNGEFVEFPRANIYWENTPEDVEMVFIDALVKLSDGDYLYQGFLVDYELTKQGGLDCLYLIDPIRQKMNSKFLDSSQQKEIPGGIFILKYEHVINLNIGYYKMEDITEGSGGEARTTLTQVK